MASLGNSIAALGNMTTSLSGIQPKSPRAELPTSAPQAQSPKQPSPLSPLSPLNPPSSKPLGPLSPEHVVEPFP